MFLHASYKVFSLTPNKLLETQIFEKKCYLSCEKKFGPFFYIIEYDRPYGTNFYKIYDVNLAPRDLSLTHERLKGVPERLEIWRLNETN